MTSISESQRSALSSNNSDAGSDDGLVDEEAADATTADAPSLSPSDRVRAWLRVRRCYLIAVLCILVVAVGLGAAPAALDLNGIEQYSPRSTFANRVNVRLWLPAPVPRVINSTELFVAPIARLWTSGVASNVVLNATGDELAAPTVVSATVDITAFVNVSAADVLAAYNASGVALRSTVELRRSVFTAVQQYTVANAWLTLFVVCGILILLLQEDTVPPDVLMLALVVLTLARVITVREALAGFANEGIATIGALYMVALAVGNSGALDLVSRYVLGAPTSPTVAVARLMVPLAIMSAFINNTPIVAMMAPVVVAWAHRSNMAPSKLLIPLSYAAILGGTMTLIGTSTNLIVKALLVARDPKLQLSLFGIAPVGVPTAVLGILYMVFVGHRLLPARESPGQQFQHDPRAYSAHVVVKKNASALIGKTLGDAGLRHLSGLFIYSVERPSSGEIFDAPSSLFVLEAGDILGVAGDVQHVNRLWRIEGLELNAEDDVRKLRQSAGGHRLVECVVARSALVGKTPREVKFRSRFNAAIVGLHRRGERVVARIGDVRLETGDVLLLVTAGADFIQMHRRSKAFALVSEIGAASVRKTVSWLRVAFVLVLTIAMIVLASIDEVQVSLFTLALVVSYIFWLTKIITADDARSSVDIGVMTMVASSIGLSSAMQNSGLALRIGTSLIDLFAPVGELGLLFGIYIATTVLNAFVSNSASVSLMFPIAYVIATNAKVLNVTMMCYVLMLAGSADFSTPIGYQTNLMVYALGSYKFFDYTRVGMPLQLICCIVGCLIGYYAYQV